MVSTVDLRFIGKEQEVPVRLVCRALTDESGFLNGIHLKAIQISD